MPENPEGDQAKITALISASVEEVPGARDRLYSLVYDELHRIAAGIQRQCPEQSLCPTEIVNEAYPRLAAQRYSNVRDRSHFYHIAATVIRRVLVDRARAQGARKRGGDLDREPLSTAVDARSLDSGLHRLDILALEEALRELERESPKRAQVVELRFFGGRSVEETAAALGVAEITVKRYWKFAQAWLRSKMSQAEEEA